MKKYLILLFLALFITATVFPQDSLTRKQARKQQKSYLLPGRPWTLEVPLWIPGFAGSFAYGDIKIEGEDGIDPEHPVEPPPGGDLGEILSRIFTKDWYLKFFFLTRIAYENKNVLVQLDGVSGAVGAGVKFKYNNTQIVEARFRTTNIRFFAGYRMVNTYSKNKKFRYELYPYIGSRAYFQNVYSSLGNEGNELDIHPTWFEPLIGIQNQFNFKRWYLVLQGDIGGLFVESKYSYQISGYAYYRTGRLTSVKFGWNHLYINQVGTFIRKDYSINATFSGPSVAIVFHF